jgi:hypothetical protein
MERTLLRSIHNKLLGSREGSVIKAIDELVFILLFFCSMVWAFLLLILPIAFATESPIYSNYESEINIGVTSSVSVWFLYSFFGKYSFQASIKYFSFITLFLSFIYLAIFGIKGVLGLSPIVNTFMGFILLIPSVILAFYFSKKVKKLKSQMDVAT